MWQRLQPYDRRRPETGEPSHARADNGRRVLTLTLTLTLALALTLTLTLTLALALDPNLKTLTL